MEIVHFSHEHPLVLNENNAQQDVSCYGCNEPIILGVRVYTCSSCDNFYLHKTCAELPQQIEYPMHPQHPLTLGSRPHYKSRSCCCSVCDIDWEWFTYECIHCEFDVCVTCAITKGRMFHHEGHKQHPLTLIQRQGLFRCDACYMEAKDFSYVCNDCPFWIHQSCATSPTTINFVHHEHPLMLAYSLPERYRTFRQGCSVCAEKMNPSRWLYYCADCRYFAHIQCATSTEMELDLILSSSENENDGADKPKLLHLPVPDESSLDPIKQQLIMGISLTDDMSTAAEHITYWAHKDHPLILFDEHKRNNTNEVKRMEDQMICNACVSPIVSSSFYGCAECNFFIHRFCVELPEELQHPSHPEHKLVRGQFLEPYNYFECNFCKKCCNGIFFYCETCTFYTDIGFASLPNKIKHPVNQLKISQQDQT